jgi:hypothetical protein
MKLRKRTPLVDWQALNLKHFEPTWMAANIVSGAWKKRSRSGLGCGWPQIINQEFNPGCQLNNSIIRTPKNGDLQ